MFFLFLAVTIAGCQSVPTPEAFQGLGQSEVYEVSYDEAFRKADRALRLEAVDVLEKNPAERYIYGQFGDVPIFWERKTAVYVFFNEAGPGKIKVEIYAQGPYSERLKGGFHRSFRKLLAGK